MTSLKCIAIAILSELVCDGETSNSYSDITVTGRIKGRILIRLSKTIWRPIMMNGATISLVLWILKVEIHVHVATSYQPNMIFMYNIWMRIKSLFYIHDSNKALSRNQTIKTLIKISITFILEWSLWGRYHIYMKQVILHHHQNPDHELSDCHCVSS